MSTKIYCWKVVCNFEWGDCYFVDATTEEEAIEKAIEITGNTKFNYAMIMQD